MNFKKPFYGLAFIKVKVPFASHHRPFFFFFFKGGRDLVFLVTSATGRGEFLRAPWLVKEKAGNSALVFLFSPHGMVFK